MPVFDNTMGGLSLSVQKERRSEFGEGWGLGVGGGNEERKEGKLWSECKIKE